MKFCFFVLFASLLCPLFLAPACAENQYLTELQAHAHAKELAKNVLWLRLLHYKPNTVGSGFTSQVDDPEFFFAPDGKKDPVTELDATLAAFFSTEVPAEDKQHPQCGFPARYHWLKTELEFDPSRLPEQRCPRFEQWRDALQPAGVTLIYPAAYLNNPASMFGHTLLRIDAKGQTEETRLLAYGANYAAGTTERSGLVFAVRGIFGGYRGAFSIAPYYKLVKKYSDLENRDIWEYELNFTQDEQDQLVRHLWELGSTYFDYYFFDENCSYFLLAAFEAVRADLDLTEQYHAWVIPSDTVRTVTAVPGLVKNIIFRPAVATVIKARAAELDGSEQELAHSLAVGTLDASDPELAKLPVEPRARVLELGFEYLNYLRSTGRDLSEDGPKRGRDLLLARSKVPVDLPPVPVPTPTIRPEEGHPTARMSAGVGSEDGQQYYQLEWRPAYHDLLDPVGGYVQGAEIRFFDLAMRHYEGDNLELERFHPISIVSLSPRDRFFQPKSFQVTAGVDREPLPGNSRGSLSYGVNGGAGVTYRLGGDMLWFSALLDGATKYNESYPTRAAFGGGPAVSLLFHPGESYAADLRGYSSHFFLGEEHREQGVELEQRLSLTDRLMLRFDAAHSINFGDYRNKLEVSLQWYF